MCHRMISDGVSNLPKPAPRLSYHSGVGMHSDDEEIGKLLESKKNKKPPSPVPLPRMRGLSKSKSEVYINMIAGAPPIPPKPKSFLGNVPDDFKTLQMQNQHSSSSFDINSQCGSFYESDSDMDTDDYITVLANMEGMNFVKELSSSNDSIYAGIEKNVPERFDKEMENKWKANYSFDESFQNILSAILAAEENFIKKYIEIGKNCSYYKIRDDSKSAAAKIFGPVTDLLLLHTEMRPKIEQCGSPLELAEVFIKYKERLRLHIADQWKLCQCENPDVIVKHTAVYSSDFPTLSQRLIETYRKQMLLIYDLDGNLAQNYNFQYANKILKTTYVQIVLINIALKNVIDPNITLSECGDVLHFGRFNVKTQRTSIMWKSMDIFFMEKYIILTRKKKDKLYFVESIPAHEVDYKAKESDMTISISSKSGKKRVLLIKFPKSKISEFQTVKSILHYMNENGLNILI